MPIAFAVAAIFLRQVCWAYGLLFNCNGGVGLAIFKNFKGCKTIVRDDETGDTITETEILDFDQVMVVITLNSRPFENMGYGRVSLLVFTENEIFEFQGNVRRISVPGRISIALFKGRVKEDRYSKRYIVNAPASIISLIIDGEVSPFAEPEPVTVVNVSTDGVLVRARPNALEIPSCFQLKLMIGGSETILNNCVVRTHKSTSEYTEFGCKLIAKM